MSIQSEINRISGNVSDALDAISAKGVTVPVGSNSDDLASLIAQIQGGGGGAISIVDTPDAAGGTIRTITAVDISSDTVTAATLFNGVTAHDASGAAITGEYVAPTPKTAADVTVSGATVNIPAGAYAEAVSKSVSSMTLPINASPSPSGTSYATINAALAQRYLNIPVGYNDTARVYNLGAMPTGTAGTPTATKGAVNNHSVDVTPSVTNTTGYISGSTKTGTAVTVSASELVSGSQTITNNGTVDVTNLAEVVVSVSGGSGKAAQIASGVGRVANTAYTSSGISLTVGKTGTYSVYWNGYRSSTSGTSGSQLYVAGSAYGSANTTFNGTYTNVQNVHLSGVSLTADQTITVYARSRSGSYYMYIMNLVIIEE